jgi:hypothetical protein
MHLTITNTQPQFGAFVFLSGAAITGAGPTPNPVPGSQVTFTANPSPITLTAGAIVGKTTLTWSAPGYSALQIWVSGVLFAAGLPASGSIDTGDWVSDGLLFSLMDPVSGQPIATLTMHTTMR